jgi:catechol 2,3-dioxygenase-like lactoylglutathione lyase family enzyme
MTQAIRPHIGLAATDVHATVAFYSALFGVAPSKVKPGYAKFELKTPALNLSINSADSVTKKDSAFHMGIEVAKRGDIDAWKERATTGGLSIELEEDAVTCCYAVQDKFWVRDPDGHRWEIFVVHADAEVHTENRAPQAEAKACCEPTCCQ